MGGIWVFAIVLFLFLLVTLFLVFALNRGMRRDSTEYDNNFLWDLFQQKSDRHA